MAREIINVSKTVWAAICGITRDYPDAILRYDDTTYAKPIYRVVPTPDNVFSLREDFIAAIYKLSGGAREVPVSKLREFLENVQVV